MKKTKDTPFFAVRKWLTGIFTAVIGWIENHPATIVFFTGILALVAILVTVHFSSEGIDQSNATLKLSTKQFNFALAQQKKNDAAASENARIIAREDSIQSAMLEAFKAQSEIAAGQLKNQDFNLDMEYSRTGPYIYLENIECDTSGSNVRMSLNFRNEGDRPCTLYSLFFSVYNRQLGIFTKHMRYVEYEIPPKKAQAQDDIFVPKEAYNDKYTIYYYHFVAIDPLNKKIFYPSLYFGRMPSRYYYFAISTLSTDEYRDFFWDLRKYERDSVRCSKCVTY